MMKYIQTLLFIFFAAGLFAQDNFDTPTSRKNMKADLDMFYKMREAANSGVYKYRTKAQMDSIYQWGRAEIEQSKSIGEFYNILSKITDFEGSLHNDTELPKKIRKSILDEPSGYFPFPIKLIEGKWVCNTKASIVPLGSSIISINDKNIGKLIPELYRYYTTDGFNITGKQIGINKNFPLYYRMRFGRKESFEIKYKTKEEDVRKVTVKGVSYEEAKKRFQDRHSKDSDSLLYTPPYELIKNKDVYHSQIINDSIAIFTVNTFVIGSDAEDPSHKAYIKYLDSVFTEFNVKFIRHLIVDVRYNGGGNDPNDLVTYSYLTNRNFQENIEAWIPFRKIPYWSRIKGELPFWQKPIAKLIFQRQLKNDFVSEKKGKYYQDGSSNDHKVWRPNPNAFKGKIYLLISPRVASAGSMFASMLASDSTTITVGEETQGGYYGHNGHTAIRYQLKYSKIKTSWFIVNLKQDVRTKESQPFGYGILPHYRVEQSYSDFLDNEDTAMKFLKNLIQEK